MKVKQIVEVIVIVIMILLFFCMIEVMESNNSVIETQEEQFDEKYNDIEEELQEISETRAKRMQMGPQDAVKVKDLICKLDKIDYGPYTSLKQRGDSMRSYYKFMDAWK